MASHKKTYRQTGSKKSTDILAGGGAKNHGNVICWLLLNRPTSMFSSYMIYVLCSAAAKKVTVPLLNVHIVPAMHAVVCSWLPWYNRYDFECPNLDFFRQFCRIRVNFPLYESKTTDKWEQYNRRAEKNLDGSFSGMMKGYIFQKQKGEEFWNTANVTQGPAAGSP